MTRRYYEERKMEKIRQSFDEKILKWPNVHTKKMFGCPCYQARDRLFAFLVTNGVVVTQLDQTDREELSRRLHVSSFHAGKRIVQNWLRIPVGKAADLAQVLPFVRRSYESAILKAE